MSARDWIRERVDIGLLTDDLAQPDKADPSSSPFEKIFTNQNGELSADHVNQHCQAFQRFCDTGEEGDTLIFFAHADSYTEKIPRKDAIKARESAMKAKADAIIAQAEAQKKSTDVKKEESEEKKDGSNELPNAAKDELLYDVVTKERFRYRCVTARQLEDMILEEMKQETSNLTTEHGEVKESAHDVMSAMHSGVVYFVRKTSESFSTMKTTKQLGISNNVPESIVRDLSMASKVEWGCLRGLSSQNLTQLNSCINSIFLPFLDGMMADKTSTTTATSTVPSAPSVSPSTLPIPTTKTDDNSSNSSSGAGSGFWSHAVEFRSQMSKFKGQLDSAIQQTRGRVSLPMRLDILLDENKIDQAAADFETFRALEEMLGEWTEVVKDVVAQQQRAEPTGRGPMAEIEFWRHQHGMLSAMYEQLSSERALMVLQVLKVAGSTLLDDYRVNHSELTRLHVEAADNVKFLATLERHFKNIENGSGDLRIVSYVYIDTCI
jgi:hypothetical protein